MYTCLEFSNLIHSIVCTKKLDRWKSQQPSAASFTCCWMAVILPATFIDSFVDNSTQDSL